MSSEKLPTKVYKYMRIDQFCYEMLIKSELWFSKPQVFNDPFDINIGFNGPTSDEDFEAFAQSFKKQAPNLNGVSNSTITTFLKDNPAVIQPFIDVGFKAKENAGVCCFTSEPNNLLMWAHYADCHRGICLEFDINCLKGTFDKIGFVNYCQEMPKIRFYENVDEAYYKASFSKSIDWSYEKEIRIIKEKFGLHPFDKKAITGVVFGLKAPSEQIRAIYSLMHNLGFVEINYQKAELSKTEFKLDYVSHNI